MRVSWKSQIKKLSFEDRERLMTKREELKGELRNSTEPGPERVYSAPHLLQDTGSIQKEISRLEVVLDKDNALEAKGPERTKLDRRRKEIESELAEVIPTMEEERRTLKSSGIVDFERAVQKTMRFTQHYQKLVEEWKNIIRRLDPEDPMADSVDILRKRVGALA